MISCFESNECLWIWGLGFFLLGVWRCTQREFPAISLLERTEHFPWVMKKILIHQWKIDNQRGQSGAPRIFHRRSLQCPPRAEFNPRGRCRGELCGEISFLAMTWMRAMADLASKCYKYNGVGKGPSVVLLISTLITGKINRII